MKPEIQNLFFMFVSSGSACLTSCNQSTDLDISFRHIDLRLGAFERLRVSTY